MAHSTHSRRALVRTIAAGTATATATLLAGCGDREDDEPAEEDGGPEETEEDPNDPGGYREDGVDPGSDQDAGTSDGGSSAG